MDTTDGGTADVPASFTWQDVESWAANGVIDAGAPARIWDHVSSTYARIPGANPLPAFASDVHPPAAPAGRRLSLTSIASYLGGFMVLLAFTIFVGIQWEGISDGSRLVLSTVSLAVVLGIGLALRGAGAETAGGLLAVAAAGIVPLVVYSFQKAAGIWPDGRDPGSYRAFHSEILPAWVGMEVVSIAVTVGLLVWLRFPLLTLLVAFWGWYLSMDLARWVAGADERAWGSEGEQLWSLVIAAAMIGVGVVLQIRSSRDYSLWLYLFGHVTVLTNLTQLTLGNDVALGWLIFPVVYVAVIVGSVWLQRSVFLVFGSLGLFLYLCYLSSVVFEGALGFTFGLALIGILVVLTSVWFQRRGEALIRARVGRLQRA